jgi:hypothetical protein
MVRASNAMPGHLGLCSLHNQLSPDSDSDSDLANGCDGAGGRACSDVPVLEVCRSSNPVGGGPAAGLGGGVQLRPGVARRTRGTGVTRCAAHAEVAPEADRTDSPPLSPTPPREVRHPPWRSGAASPPDPHTYAPTHGPDSEWAPRGKRPAGPGPHPGPYRARTAPASGSGSAAQARAHPRLRNAGGPGTGPARRGLAGAAMSESPAPSRWSVGWQPPSCQCARGTIASGNQINPNITKEIGCKIVGARPRCHLGASGSGSARAECTD